MTEPYTPTTGAVRSAYTAPWDAARFPVRSEEFDRWYAEEIRKAKEAAWDESYTTALGDFDIAARAAARSNNPYRAS